MSDESRTSVSGTPIERRLFSEGQLSIGLTLPLLASGNVVADFDEQIALAKLSDELGFSALWVRDVPLNSIGYPDPIGHLDPWVFLGALASHTKKIALVSGAIVLTLRHPLHIAKGAVSVNTLSRGRFILGLGSGDRPPEYAAFGSDSNQRRDLYRQHWDTVASAVGSEPRVIADRSPPGAPEFFLLPRGSTPIPSMSRNRPKPGASGPLTRRRVQYAGEGWRARIIALASLASLDAYLPRQHLLQFEVCVLV
jgi:luciferase-type oxidoreductase